MRFDMRNKIILIDASPAIFAAVVGIWSYFYWQSVASLPVDAQASVFFIEPLFWVLAVGSVLIVVNCIQIKQRPQPAANIEKFLPKPDPNLRNKFLFSLVLIAYAFSLDYLGYIIPTLAFMFGVSWCMGTRDWRVFCSMALFICIFAKGVFGIMLRVPLPFWPWSN